MVDEGGMHRLIVTSATYRQSASVTPELLAKDAGNTLLARGPRVRFEAEQIRDSAAPGGGIALDETRRAERLPPHPASVTTEGTYGGLQWKVSDGEDRYRRGLYTFSKRTAPFAMTNTFDGPSGETCLARREPTNTPLQALTMLNDAVILEAAQAPGAANHRLRGDRGRTDRVSLPPLPRPARLPSRRSPSSPSSSRASAGALRSTPRRRPCGGRCARLGRTRGLGGHRPRHSQPRRVRHQRVIGKYRSLALHNYGPWLMAFKALSPMAAPEEEMVDAGRLHNLRSP